MYKKIVFTSLNILVLVLMVSAQKNAVSLTGPSGSTQFFPSITTAYDNIPTQLANNYIMELQDNYDGTDTSEVYPIRLSEKTYQGSYHITLRPALGNKKAVIKRPVPAAGGLLQLDGADYMVIDGRPGGINTDSSFYLTLIDSYPQNLTGSNVELLNGASHNVIEYIKSVAVLPNSVLGSRNIYIAGGSASNDSNVIRNCIVSGGLRGIQDYGSSMTVYNSGNIIENNIVRDFGSPAIFAGAYQSGIIIRNNTVINLSNTIIGGLNTIMNQTMIGGESFIEDNTININYTRYGMDAIEGISVYMFTAGTTHILRNKIVNLSSKDATQINGISASGLGTLDVRANVIQSISGDYCDIMAIVLGTDSTNHLKLRASENRVYGLKTGDRKGIRGITLFISDSSDVKVMNNFIAITDENPVASPIYGIRVQSKGKTGFTTGIFYNTIRISNNKAGNRTMSSLGNSIISAGIIRDDQTAGSIYRQRNNIIINERQSGDGLNSCFYNTTGTGSLNIDYNTYYSKGASPVIRWVSTDYGMNDLAAYKSAVAPREKNANFNYVYFASDTDLHLYGASLKDTNLQCVPVSGITKDIDGDLRSVSLPIRGADEVKTTLPLLLLSFGSEVNGKMLQLKWKTVNEINLSQFVVEHKINEADYDSIGTVNAFNKVTQNVYQILTLPTAGASNYYRLKIYDRDGSFTYSPVILYNATNMQNNFVITPNPAKSTATLLFNNDLLSAQIRVFDIQGRPVFQQKVSGHVFKLPVNHLAAGIYTVSIKTDKEIFTRLLVVAK